MTLQHVDSVIAFAVVMLGASLMIMILTQGISTVSNLRGQQLLRSLRDLLQNTHPELSDKSESVARRILEHPLLSDSRFGSNDHRDERYRKPLAIAVGAVGGAIGSLLVDGLERRISVFVTATVAIAFLLHYLARNWELASAIRLEELLRVAKLVDRDTAIKLMSLRADDALAQQLSKLDDLAKDCSAALVTLTEQLRAKVDDASILELLDVVSAGIGTHAERLSRIARLRARVSPELAPLVDALGEVVAAEQSLESDKAGLALKWQAAVDAQVKEMQVLFNAAMDRASQRFASSSRLWTIAFSIAFAFLTHLDAIALYKRLSSDAELRSKLLASSEAMMKQADKILVVTPAASAAVPPASPAAVVPAASPAPVTPPSTAISGCLSKYSLHARVPGIYTAALLCPAPVDGLAEHALARKELGPFATREDALDYLAKRLAGKATHDAQLDRYRENLSQLLQSSEVTQLFDQAASINSQLARSGLELIPDPYPGIRPTAKELPGLLVAAALLSLGAPFWFNLLKTLANLRPLVATREQKERESSKSAVAAL
jgi:hypothetical protein